jgi:hypothetical protein
MALLKWYRSIFPLISAFGCLAVAIPFTLGKSSPLTVAVAAAVLGSTLGMVALFLPRRTSGSELRVNLLITLLSVGLFAGTVILMIRLKIRADYLDAGFLFCIVTWWTIAVGLALEALKASKPSSQKDAVPES